MTVLNAWIALSDRVQVVPAHDLRAYESIPTWPPATQEPPAT